MTLSFPTVPRTSPAKESSLVHLFQEREKVYGHHLTYDPRMYTPRHMSLDETLAPTRTTGRDPQDGNRTSGEDVEGLY